MPRLKYTLNDLTAQEVEDLIMARALDQFLDQGKRLELWRESVEFRMARMGLRDILNNENSRS